MLVLQGGEDPHLTPDRCLRVFPAGVIVGAESLQRVLAAGRLFPHEPHDGAAAAPETTADVVSGNRGRHNVGPFVIFHNQ